MRPPKELVAIFDVMLSPLLVSLAFALPAAVFTIALSARSACACSTMESAYRMAMRSDLRNLVSAQEVHFAEHGTYAVSLSPAEHRFSTGVRLVSMRTGASGFTAVVGYPTGTERRCRIAYIRGQAANSVCDPAPRRGWLR